jgi:hypothetical protein
MAGATDDVGMTIADADSKGIQRDQQNILLASQDPRKLKQLQSTPYGRGVLNRRGLGQTAVSAARGGKLYKKVAY